MKLTNLFVENTSFMDELDYSVTKFKISFFSAAFGSGKTTVLAAFARRCHMPCIWYDLGQEADVVCCESTDFLPNTCYIIEELHLFVDHPCFLRELSAAISAAPPTTRFLLSSRGCVPPVMNTFLLNHELQHFQLQCLLFNREMLLAYLKKRKITLDQPQAMEILRITKGYPLAIQCLVDLLENGYPFSNQIASQAQERLFGYFDSNLFFSYPEKIRVLLLKLAHFQNLNPESVSYVFPDSDIMQQIYDLRNYTSFFQVDRDGNYQIKAPFRHYLMKKQEQLLPPEERTLLFSRLADYEESQNHILQCVTLYQLLGNQYKVAQVLEDNVKKNHVGAVDYFELESCYLTLPEDIVADSPALLSGLSILHSLFMRVERSEQYYSQLIDLQKRTPAGTDRYYEILRYVIYLQMALPHKGNINIVKLVLQSATLMLNHEFQMQPMSITGNMPSLMNGGKDFCSWARHDQLLYNLLNKPIHTVFDKYSIALPEIAMGESSFEKNRIGQALPLLTKGVSTAELSGTPEMYFAGQGVMIRMMVSQGELSEAITLLEKIEDRSIKKRAEYLIPNIHALRTRLYLYANRTTDALQWLDLESPSEADQFYTTRRNEYLAKIRVLIMSGKHVLAYSLIERIALYATLYAREYIYMEVNVLKCILLYRMQDPSYKELLEKMIVKARSHQFIRVIADEGAAVWKLLQEVPATDDYMKRLRAATKRQMLLYPDYLKQPQTLDLQLSEHEIEILRLLSEGLTNHQISESLMKSTHTVKYHLGNIFNKLEVSNRTSAVKKAHELGFI